VADYLGLYQPGLIGDLGIVIMIINNINQLGNMIHYNYHNPRPGNPDFNQLVWSGTTNSGFWFTLQRNDGGKAWLYPVLSVEVIGLHPIKSP
jgi:hypothetical protein